MLTFSINTTEGNSAYSVKVWTCINSNLGYFKKFNSFRWEEAVQKAYIYALEHRDDTYEDITPYMKKLARTILKVKEQEKPYDMYTEDGEVSLVFTTLTESMDDTIFSDKEEIKSVFKELYLHNPEDFEQLKNIFCYDTEKDILSVRALQIKDEVIKTAFQKLSYKHGGNTVFYVLYDFFKDLPIYIGKKNPRLIKDIYLKESNFNVITKIPDEPCVMTNDGKLHSIDKNTLTMDLNVDFVKWDTPFATNCDILKIDLSPLLDYMYSQVYVEQGVSTKHITWCDDKYRLVTPGGYVVIGGDREKFIDSVRVEVILNVLMNNINTIIAVSDDSIFLKPTRSVYFDTLRLHTVTGKMIDLPVTTYIKKRKR